MPLGLRDPVGYAQAKKLAQESKVGRRQGVLSVPAIISRASEIHVPASLGGFPVMSYSEQVSLLGADQGDTPPDTQLAAGPTYLLEMDNSAGSVWTKAGGLVSYFDLNSFFLVPVGYFFSDPRVVYDAISGRWFASGLSFDSSNDSHVYVAVSQSSDPTNTWFVYDFGMVAGIVQDQPMTGVNDDKVVLSWNDYTSTSFIGQETWVLQKSDMLSGGSVNYQRFLPDTTRFRVVPSQSLSSTSTEWLTYDNSGSSTLGVVAITGTPSLGTVAWTEYDPAVAPTSQPPNPLQPGGTTDNVQLDDRLVSAVWQSGLLWAGAAGDACIPSGDASTRSCLRLFEVSTTGLTPTVAQDFDVGTASAYLYYPAITLDRYGNAFFSYSESSLSMYPSAVEANQLATSPGTLDGSAVFESGSGSYCSACSTPFLRWGDYSGAAVDPSNPADVWLTAEYMASSTDQLDWGTATAKLAVEPFITTVAPDVGPSTGGQAITITGGYFQAGASVSIASNAAVGVTVVSNTKITAKTPPGPVGLASVTVRNPDGTVLTAPALYTYTRTTTTTAVASSSNPSTVGGGVTYTATVAPTPDGGTVAFTDNATTLTGCAAAAVNTSTGKASCTTSYSAVGSHAILASYSGDTNYAASSGSLTQQVNRPGASQAPPHSPSPRAPVGQSAPSSPGPRHPTTQPHTAPVMGAVAPRARTQGTQSLANDPEVGSKSAVVSAGGGGTAGQVEEWIRFFLAVS